MFLTTINPSLGFNLKLQCEVSGFDETGDQWIESDLTMSGTGSLVSTRTGTAVWTVEAVTTGRSLNTDTSQYKPQTLTFLHLTGISQCEVSEQTSSSEHVCGFWFVYRYSDVAERWATWCWNLYRCGANGETVNASRDGGALQQKRQRSSGVWSSTDTRRQIDENAEWDVLPCKLRSSSRTVAL